MHVSMFPRPQTKALMAAMTVQPPSGRDVRAYDWFYRGVVGMGLLALVDVGYLHAAHDEQAARLNFAAPGTFTATNVNSTTFTAYRGFTGDGSTMELDTGFNPTTASSPQFTQNSAHIGSWALTNLAAGNNSEIGLEAAAELFINPRNGSDAYTARVNTSGTLTSSSTDSRGHNVACRTASNLMTSYKNGASIDTDATASSALTSGTIRILRFNLGYSARQTALSHAGAGLTDAEVLALYNAFRPYMQAVGAVA